MSYRAHTFKLRNSSGTLLGELVSARSRWVNLALNQAGAAGFTLDLTDPYASSIIAGNSTLECWRGSDFIFSGRCTVDEVTLEGDNESIVVSAMGWFNLFEKRLYAKFTTKKFTAIDEGEIAWQLIAASQAETGGNLGITKGTIQASANATISYLQKPIKDAILELAAGENGFNFEITPNKVFNVYAPTKGSVKPNAVFYYPITVFRISRSKDSAAVFNAILGLGKIVGANQKKKYLEDAASIALYGRNEKTATWSSINDLTNLSRHVQGELNRRKNIVPVFKVFANSENAPDYPTDFSLGDKVRLVIDAKSLTDSVLLRVLGINFTIDDRGLEETELVTT